MTCDDSVLGQVVSAPVNIISDGFATLLILLGFAGLAAGIVLEVSALTLLGAVSFVAGLVVHFVWVGKR